MLRERTRTRIVVPSLARTLLDLKVAPPHNPRIVVAESHPAMSTGSEFLGGTFTHRNVTKPEPHDAVLSVLSVLFIRMQDGLPRFGPEKFVSRHTNAGVRLHLSGQILALCARRHPNRFCIRASPGRVIKARGCAGWQVKASHRGGHQW